LEIRPEKIMKVHILGCGDAFGSGGRNQSGYLVEADQRFFLLDCGPTTLLAMKRAGLDPKRLDAILLSHLHGDHFGGIPFFFLEYLYKRPRDKPLHIAGPTGSEEKARELFRIMYGSGSVSKDLPPTQFHVLQPETSANIAGIEIFPFHVPHQVHEVSLGLKVGCEQKQILFSGDSAWTELFVNHARGVDLFLCECSFYDEAASNHVNYLALSKNLSRLECKKLVLTHLGEEMLARKTDLTVTMAEDGMVIEL
jgi:ribonuclease BN (tRNA processing enzyme)